MHYLHTMVRVEDLDRALDFYVNKLGLEEVNRREDEQGRYTNVFLKAPGDDVSERRAPLLELTYNWPARPGEPEKYTGGRNPDDSTTSSVGTPTLRRGFGHLAYAVENIYEYCKRLMDLGVVINRPPRDGRMAFIRSPEGISIELLQIGEPLPPQEPWQSMENTGMW